MQLTSRFRDALIFAMQLHADQDRKLTERERLSCSERKRPYVGHLLAVSSMVIDCGRPEDEVIAALLHDAVEDRGGRAMAEKIASLFGPSVRDLVLECSDAEETPKPPWLERKQKYLAHLEKASTGALYVSLADKIHNGRSLLLDIERYGEEVWNRFHATKEQTLWYYDEFSKVIRRRLPDEVLVQELTQIVQELHKI
ncbi:HD domain-containing protein [Heliobacterium chlorum]|uniref:HD domain-containing protein n=1 Tax=Heliobacterium chlorum TaxID=2698 RepID=A0ABR7T1H3_HELCL|nr:HD domain-containing protein [Heliobacterium chlorum]MBC9783699.1 HD domain-containing protein [Heliobacterium chlorum]